MTTMVTSGGQVVILKTIRDALHLLRGYPVALAVHSVGDMELRKTAKISLAALEKDRFDHLRGAAGVKRRTDALMALQPGADCG